MIQLNNAKVRVVEERLAPQNKGTIQQKGARNGVCCIS